MNTPKLRLQAVDRVIKDGYMSVSDRPGLGVEPNMDVLGGPVFSIG